MADYDLLIIGGGAAGLTAAQYGARSGMKTALLEAAAPGGQALQIDHLENYPGFTDSFSGFDMANRFQQQAEAFGARFIYDTAESLCKTGDEFSVTTAAGTITALSVIIATGAKHRHLNIPGETELAGKGVSYCATCDGPFFKNQRILVVGGGDAACDEALFLSKLSDRVTLIHRKGRFRAQKAVADRVLANPRIRVRMNTVPLRILGDRKVEQVELKATDTDTLSTEPFDAVFIFVGTQPQTEGFADLAPLNEAGYILTDEKMQTQTPGLFAAGDVRDTPFRQVVTAAADGAVAAHAANEYVEALKGQSYR